MLWFGGFRIEAGVMEVGSLIAFLSYLMQIPMAVMMTTMLFVLPPPGQRDDLSKLLTHIEVYTIQAA